MWTRVCAPAAAALLLLGSPLQAQIEWISGAVMTSDFRKTVIPFMQGRTTEYVLKGPWLDYAATVDGLGSGVTLSKLQTSWPNARVTLGLVVSSSATPGRRTLTLRKAKGWGQTVGDKIDNLDIYVVRAGTFEAGNPVLSKYFNEVGVRVNGAMLGDAVVLADGWPAGTTATLDASSTGTFAVLRLRFPTLLSQASGDILFHDRGMPTLCHNLAATYYYKVGGTTGIRQRVKVTGRNAIKTISFPYGKAVSWGATTTIRLTFYEPIRPEGETVYWSLSSNQYSPYVLTAQGVSPAIPDAAAQVNQLHLSAGVTSVDLKVKVCKCLGGTWTVTVHTWFGTPDATGPGVQEGSFTVSCPAGGTVGCP